LISTLRMQFDPSDRSKSPTIPEQTALGPRRDTIFAVMFAIYSVFRIFAGDEITADDDILPLDHPPAIYRQRFILGTVLEFVNKCNVISLDDFKEITGQVVRTAEDASSKLTGKPIDTSFHAPDTFKRSTELLNALLENWKAIRPQLDALKRGGNLAP
jgi:hypothetical protein